MWISFARSGNGEAGLRNTPVGFLLQVIQNQGHFISISNPDQLKPFSLYDTLNHCAFNTRPGVSKSTLQPPLCQLATHCSIQSQLAHVHGWLKKSFFSSLCRNSKLT